MIILRSQNRFRIGLLLGLVLLSIWVALAYHRWEMEHRLPPAGARLVVAPQPESGGSAAGSHKAERPWKARSRPLWPIRGSFG